MEGKLKGKSLFTMEEEVTKPELTTFCEGEKEMAEWNFLEIECLELK